jgi:hypothetical protein
VNTSAVDGIFLSEKAKFSVVGSGYFHVPSAIQRDYFWFEVLNPSLGSHALFPLHEACIETSCQALDHHRAMQTDPGEKIALATLYNILDTRFRASTKGLCSPLQPVDIDLFDLCACSSLYGPRSVLAMTKLEWWGGEYEVRMFILRVDHANVLQKFYTNPAKIPDELASFVYDVLLSSARAEEETVTSLRITREPKGIERLPTELHDEILKYLPAQSTIALHQTSKALAIKIPLDNKFWRDSLRNGRLHPHLWGLDTQHIEQIRQTSGIESAADDWDWRSLARVLATKRFPIFGCDPRLDDLPLGLWNRCRIWTIVEEALACDALRPPPTKRTDSGTEIREKRKPIQSWELQEQFAGQSVN